MSITLTNNGTTIALGDRLDWQDEYDWSAAEQATTYSSTGALLVDVATKQAGRPITLVGSETVAMLDRTTCNTLHAWAQLPGLELNLVLRGQSRTVLFDHAKGGFTARPIWHLLDAEHGEDAMYYPTFRFLEV